MSKIESLAINIIRINDDGPDEIMKMHIDKLNDKKIKGNLYISVLQII